MIQAALDALLVDIGGTLVEEAAPGTPVSDLTVRPLPGVVRDLARIADELPIVGVTNTAVMLEADVMDLLNSAGLGRHLQGIVTSAEIGIAKPDPAPLLVALDRLGPSGLDRSRVLYVGDLPTDEAAALAAGVPYATILPEGLLATVAKWIAAGAGSRFRSAANLVSPPDGTAARAAAALQLRLTKPAGSLGRLEGLGVRLAAMSGTSPPPPPTPAAIAVFAADHGVVADGVTPWPQAVTAQMVANFAAGGAAVSVLARQMGASLTVVDVGVAGIASPAGVLRRRVRAGTDNLSQGSAMSVTEARLALDVGAEVAQRLHVQGAKCLVTGDMGIGNTTASAALISAITGLPASAVTGRGTGIDDAMLVHKTDVVAGAAGRCAGLGPLEALAETGGLEIAALAGFVVGGAAARVPVLLDGVVTVAAALVAESLVPGVKDWCVAGHLSVEPGAAVALEYFGLQPLLNLELRLGEGTGAILALPLVEAAARLLAEMATFDSAGVSEREA